MTEIAIRCEGLSKQYRIGERESYQALRDVIADAASSPFRRMRAAFNGKGASSNGANGSHSSLSAHDASDEIRNSKSEIRNSIWALDDVSFEVKQGEVVGIIGRNGAGKSTLLKILSRITKPTKGHAKIFGRVGSLLEVGTGFHPELTGRENIYLNGAILGMRKAEIERKFDEIVAFAEVEKFIDTPVKRYSSGMYVRLAFAVAAHMETEVLIVDEVLAVGDAQFQKKCLGKIGEVAQQGKTVLFVSHNMPAVRALCNRAVIINKGRLILDTHSENAVAAYLADETNLDSYVAFDGDRRIATDEIGFLEAYVLDDRENRASVIDCAKPFSIVIEYQVHRPLKDLRIGFGLRSAEGIAICGSNDPTGWPHPQRNPGRYMSRCTFPGYTLNTGNYSVCFAADAPGRPAPNIETPFCLSFSVEDLEGYGPWRQKLPGVIRPNLTWDVVPLSESKETALFVGSGLRISD